jgi:putative transposase
MHSSAGRWPGKKPLGDKERAEPKRKASLRLRERYRRRGKDFGYIDERGFAPAVTRRYASAPTGRRVYGLCSGHRRPRTSLLAARIGSPLATPLLFDGTCNTTLFNAWLTQELCPLLHDTHVGVLDHVPFHQSATTKELIMTTGATLLFLPPYSPDLNPLEHDFAAIKKLREYNE